MFKMKSFIFCFFIVTFFSSCSDDNNKDDISNIELTNESLAGNWRVADYSNTQVVITTENANGNSSTETSQTLGQDFTLVYAFSPAPKIITSSGIYTAFASLSNGNIVESDLNAIVGIQPGSSWNISNDKITLTNPDFTQDLIVKSFNGNTLELDFIHEYEYENTLYSHEYSFSTNIILEKE